MAEHYGELVCPIMSSVVKTPDEIMELAVGVVRHAHCIGPQYAAFQGTGGERAAPGGPRICTRAPSSPASV